MEINAIMEIYNVTLLLPGNNFLPALIVKRCGLSEPANNSFCRLGCKGVESPYKLQFLNGIPAAQAICRSF